MIILDFARLRFAHGRFSCSFRVWRIAAAGRVTAPGGVAANAAGEISVTNDAFRGPEILVFAAGANGNVKPIRIIHGPKTNLIGLGIALSSRGTIFTANYAYDSGSSSVTVYRAEARGNATAIREISGADTGLNMPAGIAVR